MNSERSRLRTFQNWPSNAPVDYERIAKAGFYYMGQNLEVQCFSCGGRISEWQYGDMVMAKHRLLDPRCPFVLNPSQSGNVPVTELSNESIAGGTSRVLHERQEETNSDDSSKYKNEVTRIESFLTWPIPTKVDGYRLVKAGFYYLQELDKVRCAFCGIDVYNWETGDEPIVEHRRHSPTCPFLSNLSFGCSSRNADEIITLRNEYFNFEPELGIDASRMKEFGILNHRIPKHSKYMTEETRLSSFDNWLQGEIINPVELAAAGFYYTGVDDKVRCYHCGGGLQKWKANDDPWVEHAKWFPTCDFLYLVKGEEFIDTVEKTAWSSMDSEGQHSSNSNTSGSPSSQTIDDNILQCLMTSPPVLSILGLGLDVSSIKQVLRDQLKHKRKTSLNTNELIAAVLEAHFNEPVADLTEENWIDETEREIRELRHALSSAIPDPSNVANQYYRSRDDDQHNLNIGNEYQYYRSRDDDQHSLNIVNEYEINLLRESSHTPTPTDDESENETLAEENSTVKKQIITPSFAETREEGPKSAQLLEEENRKLKEAKLCKICMDQDVNIVFLPCGHLATCSSCAANIQDCPVCRQMIKGTVRTFLA